MNICYPSVEQVWQTAHEIDRQPGLISLFCQSSIILMTVPYQVSWNLLLSFSLFISNACIHFSYLKVFIQLGAAAVNLVAGEKPADVYSGIAAR